MRIFIIILICSVFCNASFSQYFKLSDQMLDTTNLKSVLKDTSQIKKLASDAKKRLEKSLNSTTMYIYSEIKLRKGLKYTGDNSEDLKRLSEMDDLTEELGNPLYRNIVKSEEDPEKYYLELYELSDGNYRLIVMGLSFRKTYTLDMEIPDLKGIHSVEYKNESGGFVFVKSNKEKYYLQFFEQRKTLEFTIEGSPEKVGVICNGDIIFFTNEAGTLMAYNSNSQAIQTIALTSSDVSKNYSSISTAYYTTNYGVYVYQLPKKGGENLNVYFFPVNSSVFEKKVFNIQINGSLMDLKPDQCVTFHEEPGRVFISGFYSNGLGNTGFYILSRFGDLDPAVLPLKELAGAPKSDLQVQTVRAFGDHVIASFTPVTIYVESSTTPSQGHMYGARHVTPNMFAPVCFALCEQSKPVVYINKYSMETLSRHEITAESISGISVMVPESNSESYAVFVFGTDGKIRLLTLTNGEIVHIEVYDPNKLFPAIHGNWNSSFSGRLLTLNTSHFGLIHQLYEIEWNN